MMRRISPPAFGFGPVRAMESASAFAASMVVTIEVPPPGVRRISRAGAADGWGSAAGAALAGACSSGSASPPSSPFFTVSRMRLMVGGSSTLKLLRASTPIFWRMSSSTLLE